MWTRRSPDRGRPGAAVWSALLIAVTSVSAAAADADVRAERERIAAERVAVERRHADAQADCARRFVVTPCANEATRQRRLAVEALNRQTLAIDESERRRQAAVRLRTIDAKAAAHVARRAASAVPPAVEPLPGALVPRGAGDPARSGSSASGTAAAAAAAAQRARDAAERVVERDQRLAEAQAHRAAVERRQRERRISGRAAAPLSLPASAAAPRP